MRRNRGNHSKTPHVREGIYIKRILKQIDNKSGISVKSVQIITSLIRDIAKKLLDESFHLLSLKNKKTLSAREIQTSVRLVLNGELIKHSISEGIKAVHTSTDGGKSKSTIIPPSFLKSKIKQMNLSYRISKTSLIYLAAVIEYITCEVLELANNSSKNLKRAIITPRDISIGIFNDDELSKVFKNVIIPGGGVKNVFQIYVAAPSSSSSNESFPSYPFTTPSQEY